MRQSKRSLGASRCITLWKGTYLGRKSWQMVRVTLVSLVVQTQASAHLLFAGMMVVSCSWHQGCWDPFTKAGVGPLRRHADEGKMLSVHLLLDCLQPNCAPTPFSREGISTETASVCKQSPSDAPKRQNLGRLHSHTEMIHIFRNKQKVGFSWRTHQPQAGTHPGF